LVESRQGITLIVIVVVAGVALGIIVACLAYKFFFKKSTVTPSSEGKKDSSTPSALHGVPKLDLTRALKRSDEVVEIGPVKLDDDEIN
jgi:membrane-associated phospholipid phosphatase